MRSYTSPIRDEDARMQTTLRPFDKLRTQGERVSVLLALPFMLKS